MITAEIKPADLSKLSGLCLEIVKKTEKKLSDVLTQAAVFAIRSAAKATEPGDKSKKSALEDKYKYRPIVTAYPVSDPFTHFYFYHYNGKTFSTPEIISDETMNRKHITMVEKAYRFWNKSADNFDLTPYTGSSSGYDKKSKFGKIPNAGVGKQGWNGALGRLGKPSDGEDAKYSEVKRNFFGLDQFVEVINKIGYVAKTSPASAQRGVEAAESIMRNTYFPKLEKDIAKVVK